MFQDQKENLRVKSFILVETFFMEEINQVKNSNFHSLI